MWCILILNFVKIIHLKFYDIEIFLPLLCIWILSLSCYLLRHLISNNNQSGLLLYSMISKYIRTRKFMNRSSYVDKCIKLHFDLTTNSQTNYWLIGARYQTYLAKNEWFEHCLFSCLHARQYQHYIYFEDVIWRTNFTQLHSHQNNVI